MPEPKEYIWIAAWGRMLQSSPSYIEDEQRRAARDNAPIDAVYKRQDAIKAWWVTTEDIAPQSFTRLEGFVK